MKFIELTLTATKQKVFLNPNTIESFVWQGDFTGIGLSYTATMSVEETPETIMQLINGNQKELGWLENVAGVIPCNASQLVVCETRDGDFIVMRAIDVLWGKIFGGSDIVYYKLIEERKK